MNVFWSKMAQPRFRTGVFIALLIIFAASVYQFNRMNEFTFNEQLGSGYERYEKARVVEITKEQLEKDPNIEGLYRGTQELKLKILSGEHKGEIMPVTNYLSTMFNVHAKVGTKLVVNIATADASHINVTIYNYYRAPYLYGMIAIFLAILWAIGGKKGLKSAVALLFTFSSIVFLFLPMLYRGYSPMLAAIIVVTTTIIATLLLLDGWSSKSLSAIIGTMIGVILAGGVAILAGHLLHISGFNTNDSETLLIIADNTGMKVEGLLFAGVIIAALGAIMDLGISIASAVHEVYITNRELGPRALFLAGMNVGRDMMGTMATTLILAFTGSSLMSLLVLYAYKVPYDQLVNMNLVTIEVLQGMTGSIGVILTAPIVAFVSSRLMPYYDRMMGRKAASTVEIEQARPVPVDSEKAAVSQ
ncbi:YibE/F family protein [Paenibacillus sp. ATY16]|uniref:YibE/F family protein n=1 Tax=Paenibacillus sp. ATY16 TaxID=1759312 RepID=UPI0020109A83|nr:YibE/F family protein [Paenibacillus sp. ATY16]